MADKDKWFKDPLPCPYCKGKISMRQSMGGSYGPKWTRGYQLQYEPACENKCIFPDEFQYLGNGNIRSAKNDWNTEVQDMSSELYSHFSEDLKKIWFSAGEDSVKR